MSNFLKKVLFWVILIALFLGVVIFINSRIDKQKSEKSENNPNQKTPNPLNNDNPPNNPEPIPPTDTKNWWLTDEEIEHAYQEIGKEITNSSEIQLVSPAEARVIQEGGEISEDLKQAKYIFFPINNSEQHETAGAGSHWTLLTYSQEAENFYLYDSLSDFNKRYQREQINERKLTDKARKQLYGKESSTIIEDEQNNARQKNNSDCGVFVIAYTRVLIKRFREKGNIIGENGAIGVREKDFIFTIAEERRKLKAAGFPKKGTPGKDYEIGDDVDYKEDEEEIISQWWPKKDNPYHPLRKCVRNTWNLDRESGEPYDNADNFKEFSEKVRLLSGKINQKNTEKAKIAQIYRIKKILKTCSLPLEEYKKTKSFNGKDNFREDKITSEESQFVRENINKETVKEINNLYKIHFPGK